MRCYLARGGGSYRQGSASHCSAPAWRSSTRGSTSSPIPGCVMPVAPKAAPGKRQTACAIDTASSLASEIRGLLMQQAQGHALTQHEDSGTSPQEGDISAGDLVLDVRNLSVEYASSGGAAVRAVNDVNLTLARGQILGLAGESGSGKSTLAHAIARLLRPPARVVEGQVLYCPDPATAAGAAPPAPPPP